MKTYEPEIMFIFPGQGAQYVGMGSDIYREYGAVRRIYSKASDIVGYDIAELSFNGPAEGLNKT
ncbi:MAG: malonyl CoA-acyl carrier protein transacylase, partial [Methyloligellaceae bacterium]